MTVTTQPLTGTFVADPAHSTFRFTVTHMKVSTYSATFDDIAATVVADETGAKVEGSASVESISIRTPQEFRDHVVYGADFFDARNHPEIRFSATQAEIAEDGSAELHGDLTIKGITKPFIATGSVRPPAEDPWGNVRAGVVFTTHVDRRDWDLDWQMEMPGGGDALAYDVQIDAHVELIRQ